MIQAVEGPSRMLMHNASETTLRNVKRFHNPGLTLGLMVAALRDSSSLSVLKAEVESKHDACPILVILMFYQKAEDKRLPNFNNKLFTCKGFFFFHVFLCKRFGRRVTRRQPGWWLHHVTSNHCSRQATGLLCILIMRRSGQGLFPSLVLHVIKYATDT